MKNDLTIRKLFYRIQSIDKENKMMAIVCGVLVEKTEGKRPLGRHDIDGKIISNTLKM